MYTMLITKGIKYNCGKNKLGINIVCYIFEMKTKKRKLCNLFQRSSMLDYISQHFLIDEDEGTHSETISQCLLSRINWKE